MKLKVKLTGEVKGDIFGKWKGIILPSEDFKEKITLSEQGVYGNKVQLDVNFNDQVLIDDSAFPIGKALQVNENFEYYVKGILYIKAKNPSSGIVLVVTGTY